MAEKLLLYYKYVQDTLGLEGKIQLAKETKMPSTQAALEPDKLENIQRFRAAVEKITQRPAPEL
jgi:hypothetical protein